MQTNGLFYDVSGLMLLSATILISNYIHPNNKNSFIHSFLFETFSFLESQGNTKSLFNCFVCSKLSILDWFPRRERFLKQSVKKNTSVSLNKRGCAAAHPLTLHRLINVTLFSSKTISKSYLTNTFFVFPSSPTTMFKPGCSVSRRTPEGA